MPGRPFRWLWASAALSNTADGIVLVGVPLITVTLTRSPFLVSLASMAVTLPWLLFSLHAGAFTDRRDRRRMMVTATWARAGALAVLAVAAWLGMLNLPVLLAGVLLLGVGEVFADSAAQAVVPMAVPRDRLTDANGKLVAAQTVGNNFLGAPLAGVLVGAGGTAALGAAATLGAPALLYAAAGLALIGMRGRFRVEAPPPARSAPTSPRDCVTCGTTACCGAWRSSEGCSTSPTTPTSRSSSCGSSARSPGSGSPPPSTASSGRPSPSARSRARWRPSGWPGAPGRRER
nr:hypothetical protein GCM10020093_049170 [Planobispora longispora]